MVRQHAQGLKATGGGKGAQTVWRLCSYPPRVPGAAHPCERPQQTFADTLGHLLLKNDPIQTSLDILRKHQATQVSFNRTGRFLSP